MQQVKRGPSLPRAQVVVLANVPPVGTEAIDLEKGLGRILRRDVYSARDCPGAHVARRDGFCLAASATRNASRVHPAVFQLQGSLGAGRRPGTLVGKGRCFRIMTGAMLPEGADVVIPSEDCRFHDGRVTIECAVKPGAGVLETGGVCQAGERLARTGERLDSAVMGLLAGAGVRKVVVGRRPRMGLVSTGDELVEAGRAAPWQAYNSNAVMLAGLAQEAGADVVNLGICPDRVEDIIRCVDSSKACDVVVLTGGSSTGMYDLVPDGLEASKCRILLRGMRLRPGGHALFARKGRRVLFGLPGRPAGSFALFHVLVKPALLAMMGCTRPLPAQVRAVWGGGRVARPAVDTLVPSRVVGNTKVRPVRRAPGGELGKLARADSLALLKSGPGAVERGGPLEVFRIGCC
jgi:molybdopterin molybdotransferase